MHSLHFFEKISLGCLWVGLLILLYRIHRSIIHPLLVFIMIWFFVISVSLIFGDEYYFSFEALFYIFIMLLLFSTGWLLMSKYKSQQNFIPLKSPSFEPVLLFVGVLAGFYSIYSLFIPFFENNLQDDFFAKLSEVSSTLSRERYEGFRLSEMTLFLISLNYVACLSCGRYFFLIEGLYGKSLRLIPLLTLFLFSTVSTSRSVFLFGFVCFFTMLLLAYNEKNAFKPQEIRLSYIAYSAILVLVIFLLFVISQSLRHGVSLSNNSGILVILNHLKVWFVGNLSSYSIWYDKLSDQPELTMGCYTFGGIMEKLELVKRKVGVFPSGYDVSGHMDFSNIYTLIRFLIDDFGIYGSSILVFILGLFSGFLYEKTANGNKLALIILGAILMELYYSFILSIISYNSVFIAIFLFFLLHIIFTRAQLK